MEKELSEPAYEFSCDLNIASTFLESSQEDIHLCNLRKTLITTCLWRIPREYVIDNPLTDNLTFDSVLTLDWLSHLNLSLKPIVTHPPSYVH